MKILATLLAVFAGALILLQQGESEVNVFEAILSGGQSLTSGQQFVLFELRLPPVLAGILSGAAFGLAGSIFQNQFRNPLASPDVLGVVSGASAAVLAVGVFNLGIPVQLAAITGALTIAACVFLLGWQRGDQMTRLVVTGLSLGYLASGVSSYLLVKSGSHEGAAAFAWLVGSTRMATTASISALTVVLVLASVFVAIAAKPAKAFELGSAKAETLGFTINRWTLALVVVAVLLSAFATAAVGPIAFVALLAGPIASRLSGGRTNAFALSSTIGAGLVIASDLLIGLLFGGQHLPTGLVTGLVGSAFLIAIIFRKKGGAGV